MRTFYIGRNSDNDIVYNESSVSGRHAEITVGDDGQIVFTDYSTNGTYINGNPVHHASQSVMYGDEIIFPGNIRFDWNMIMPQPQQFVQSQQINISYEGCAGNGGFPPIPPVQESYAGNGGFDGTIPSEPLPNTAGTLDFSLAFKEGFASGPRNVLRLLAILILMLLTCWIPYINIGVLIAFATLPAQWAKDEAVNPISIFDSRFRRYMGNFVLLQVLFGITVFYGSIFMIIPGLVIYYSWSLASLFVVETGMNPLEATNASNKCTYGSKWTMFAVNLVYVLCFIVISGIFVGIQSLIFLNLSYDDMTLHIVFGLLFGILYFVFLLFAMSIGIGISGSIWRQLKQRVSL